MIALAAAAGLGCAGVGGAAFAQKPSAVPCYDRDAALQPADVCHNLAMSPGASGYQAANAYYNAARSYNAQAEAAGASPESRIANYAKAAADAKESLRRVADSDPDVIKGAADRIKDKKQRPAVEWANLKFRFGRGYELAKAYQGVSGANWSISGQVPADLCFSKSDCLSKAAVELSRERQDYASELGSAPNATAYNDFVFLRARINLGLERTDAAKADLQDIARRGGAHASEVQDLLARVNLTAGLAQLKQPVSQGTLTNAIGLLEEAARYNGTALEGQLALGGAYMSRSALPATTPERKRDLLAAETAFVAATTLARQNRSVDDESLAHEGRGDALIGRSKLDDATATETDKLLTDAIAEYGLAAAGNRRSAPQLKLARALADHKEYAKADLAYGEAIAREPATAPRIERAVAAGKAAVRNMDWRAANAAFNTAIDLGAQDGGPLLAEAYYYRSVAAVKLVGDKGPVTRAVVDDADQAVKLGGNGEIYRNQACLARIQVGGQSFLNGSAVTWCASNELLQGMYFLKRGQIVTALADKIEARREAQAAFERGLANANPVKVSMWPESQDPDIKVLLEFGRAKVQTCLGGDYRWPLDPALLDPAQVFFNFYRISCN